MLSKVVLVTGASRGIGAQVCRALASEGYSIALNYNRSFDAAKKLADELKSTADVELFQADVSDPDEVRKMFSELIERFGRIDALVNNAGISQQALITEITDDMWLDVINTNLGGTFYCCREALKFMIPAHSGKIVNVASMWGEVGASVETHYSASKGGIIALTKALAKEVGPSGININAVSPGVIMTDMMASFDDDTVDALKDETPLEKLGKPEDIADAVAFLLSEKASFITGQIISVNGGFVI